MHGRANSPLWPVMCALASLLPGCEAAAGSNPPPACASSADRELLSGTIAYESDSGDGNEMDVYVMAAPGWKPRRLTAAPGFDGHPDPSPDGKSIVFTSLRDGNKNLFLYDLETDRVTLLTSDPGDEDYARWSPDGKRLAFIAGSDIHVMQADGTGRASVTNDPAADEAVSWHPNGNELAFTSLRDGEWEIYTIGADGQKLRRITRNTLVDGHPQWSPDGKELAYSAKRGGRWDVYVLSVEGAEPRRITENPGMDWCQGWSPDGKWILVASEYDENWDVYAVSRDGERRLRLTCEEHTTRYPSWGKHATVR